MSSPRAARFSIGLCICALVMLAHPATPVHGASWAPSERLPHLLIAELNRRIEGTLRVKSLRWRAPDTVLAEQLTLHDPEGKRVASAARIELRVRPAALTKRRLHLQRVQLDGLKLDLVRDGAGLNLRRALAPRATKDDGSAPLALQIDALAASGASMLLRADELTAAAAGLTLDAALKYEDGKLDLRGGLRAGRLALRRGDVTVRLDSPQASALQVTNEALSVDGLSFRVGAAESRIGGRLSWRDAGRWDLSGVLQLPAGFWPEGLARRDLTLGALGADLRVTGALDAPRATVELTRGSLRVSGVSFDRTRGRLELAGDSVVADGLRADIGRGSVNLRGQLDLARERIEAQVMATRIGLAALLQRADLSGTIGGKLRVHGSTTPKARLELVFEGAADALGAPGVRLTEPHPLSATGSWDGELLRVATLRLAGPSLQASARGHLRSEPAALELAIEAVAPHPERLLVDPPAELSGKPLRLRGTLRGPLQEPRLEAELSCPALIWRGIEASVLQARLTATSDTATIDELRGKIAEGSLRGSLRLGLGQGAAIEGQLRARAVQLVRLPGLDDAENGGLLEADVEIGGTSARPTIALRARGESLRLFGGGPYQLRARARTRQERAVLEALEVSLLDASGPRPLLDASGWMQRGSGRLRAELQLQPVQLERLPFARRLGLSGQTSGSIEVAGTLERPELRGLLPLQQLSASGHRLGAGWAALCGRRQELRFDLRVGTDTLPPVPCRRVEEVDGGGKSVDGQIVYRLVERSLEATLRARDIEAASLVAPWPELSGIAGSVNASLDAQGDLDALSGVLSLVAPALSVDGQPVGGATLVAQVDRGEGVLVAEALGQVSALGSFSLGKRRGGAIEVELRGLAPELLLSSLRARGVRGAIDGRLALALLSGDAAAPGGEARRLDAWLDRAELWTPGGERLRLARPTSLTLEGARLTLAPTLLESGASRLLLQGSATREDLALSAEGAFALGALPLLTETVAAAEGVCDLQVKVRGSARAPELMGTLRPRPGTSVTPAAIAAPVVYSGGHIALVGQRAEIESLRAGLLGGAALLAGSLGWGEGTRTPTLDLRLSLDELDVGQLGVRAGALRGLDGRGFARLHITGRAPLLDGEAAAWVDELEVDGEPAGEVSLEATMRAGRAPFTLRALGQLDGHGVLDLRAGAPRLSATLALDGFTPERLLAPLRERRVSGRVDGALRLTYDGAREQRLHASAQLRAAQLSLGPGQQVQLARPVELVLRDRELSLPELTLESEGSSVRVKGLFSPQVLALDLEGELALATLRLLTPQISAAAGLARVQLEVRGEPARPLLRGSVEPIAGARLTPRFVGKPLQLTGGRVDFTSARILVVGLAAQGLGGKLWIDGAIDLEAGAPRAYNLTGRAEQLLLRFDLLRAEVNGELRLSGAAARPALSGEVEVLEGRFFERYQLRNFLATASSPPRLPLAERFPELASFELDLLLRGQDLQARADMASIVVDLSGDTEMRFTGSLADPSVTGFVDVRGGEVAILRRRLELDGASVELPARPDRRLVPEVELRARSVIEGDESPTGVDLPVVLTLDGNIEQLRIDVSAEEAGAQLSRAELLSLLATGRTSGALLGERPNDAALRVASRELWSELEQRVEDRLAQLASSDQRAIALQLETGTSNLRAGLHWDLSRRLQLEGESALFLSKSHDRSAGATLPPGTLRSALRARYLLADHLPLGDSVALDAALANFAFAPEVQNAAELRLELRLLQLPSTGRALPRPRPARAQIERVAVAVDHPRPGEVEELLVVLRPLQALPAIDGTARLAEQRLRQLERYRAVQCRAQERGRLLECELRAERQLRQLRFEGVPYRLLLSDLAKRVTFRIGQPLDPGAPRTRERLQHLQQRVLDYLEREGVFGAKVRAVVKPAPDDARAADLLVRVEGGRTLQVRTIKVLGAGPVAASEIAAQLRPPPWEVFTPRALQQQEERIERYHREQRNHPETQIAVRYLPDMEAGAVDLVVKVATGPHLEVRFTGEVSGDEQALRAQLSFAAATATDEVEVERGRRALERWMQQRGFWAARVRAEREEPDRRHVVVTYEIERAARRHVSAIELRAPAGFDTRALRRALDLGTTTRVVSDLDTAPHVLLPLVPGPLQRLSGLDAVGRAVADEVEDDRLRVELALVERGYAEAAVTSHLEPLDAEGLRLVFELDPGPRFVVSAVECDGSEAISCAAIRDALVHKVDTPFRVNAFDLERGRVLGLYAQRGFNQADATVRAGFERAGEVSLLVEVSEGTRARLAGVVIDGALATDREVLTRELGLRPGAPLTPAVISAGLGRLRRTRLFRMAQSRYLGMETSPDATLLQLSLEEARSLTLDSSLNFSTSELFGVEADLQERNLLGLMLDARLRGRLGYYIGRRSSVRASLGWPRIWGGPFSLVAATGYELSEQPLGGGPVLDDLWMDVEVKRLQTVASKLQLDLAASSAVGLSLAYELALDWLKRAPRLTDTAPLDFPPPVRTGALIGSIQARRLDNPFNPQRGFQLTLGAKLGSRYLGGEGDFAVPFGSAQAYHTFGRLTLGGNLRVALGFPFELGGKRYIPQRDLIIAGGDRTLRGHADASVGVATSNGTINPGLYGLTAALESRLLLFRRLWIGDVQWALFADVAYSGDAQPRWDGPALGLRDEVEARRAGLGVGTGLRYVTPIGPFILDWAVDPFHFPANRVHLTFGYAF